MALLKSIVIPLGTQMPEFTLKDSAGNSFKGDEHYGEKGLLIAFTCNHCPYAIAVWPRFVRLARYAKENGIETLAINPNIHPDYPEDSPENMKKKIQEWGIDFPYLVDETQEVAKAFKAQCTPDIFLFNHNKELIYHGRIDDHWQDENKVSREDLKEALDQHIQGLKVSNDQKPSMGCSIKWRS